MSTQKKEIILILLSSLFAGSGQLLWRRASFDLNLNVLSLLNFYLIAGIILFVIATFLMTYGLKRGELSVLLPFLSLSYVWVVLVSTAVFPEETLNSGKIISILLVVAGVSLIGLGGKKANAN